MSEASKRQLNLWVELTEHCQYKCRFCYNFWREHPAPSHRHMADDVIRSVNAFVARASSEFSVVVAVAGGDATAHRSYASFISTVSANADEVCLVTHGGRLNPSDLAAFSKLSNVSIQFSIPSLNADRYRFLTGGQQVNKVLDALAVCERLNLPIAISVVVTKHNVGDVTSLVHLAAEIRAQYVVLNRFIPSGRGLLYEQSFAICDGDFRSLVRMAYEITSMRQVKLLASGSDKDVRSRKAAVPKLTIGVEGELRVCSLVDAILGNIKDEPPQIVSRSSAFWLSSEMLPECVCSNTFPSS